MGSPHGKADQKLEDKAGHCDVAAGLREGGGGCAGEMGHPAWKGRRPGEPWRRSSYSRPAGPPPAPDLAGGTWGPHSRTVCSDPGLVRSSLWSVSERWLLLPTHLFLELLLTETLSREAGLLVPEPKLQSGQEGRQGPERCSEQAVQTCQGMNFLPVGPVSWDCHC